MTVSKALEFSLPAGTGAVIRDAMIARCNEIHDEFYDEIYDEFYEVEAYLNRAVRGDNLGAAVRGWGVAAICSYIDARQV